MSGDTLDPDGQKGLRGGPRYLRNVLLSRGQCTGGDVGCINGEVYDDTRPSAFPLKSG